jgi:ABC-type spermidine/putrescine transport system permease subunit I
MFNSDTLSAMISHAIAPAFLLGAVAALVSILIARMSGIIERIRALNQIKQDDAERAWLKDDVNRLLRREKYLNQALFLSVTAGIATTALLLIGFVSAFLGFRHEPTAAGLFVVALLLLACSLGRFLQEIRISISEHDHHS